MSDRDWAFAFILALCAALCLRFLFQGAIRRDSLSVLALCAPLLCLLSLFAWGASLPLAVTAVISLAVLAANAQPLSRFLAGLNHGGFSRAFTAASLALLIPTAAFLALIIAYRRPARPIPGVLQESAALTGSFMTGFRDRTAFGGPINAAVLTFTPQNAAGPLPLALLICDPRSAPADYAPACALLAKEGWEVKAAAFYARDNRRFGSAWDSRLLRPFACRALFAADDAAFRAFAPCAERDAAILAGLYAPAAAAEGRDVYLLSDSDALPLMKAAAKFPAAVTGFKTLNLSPLPGFGCAEQTAPLTARILGAAGTNSPLDAPREAVRAFIDYAAAHSRKE